MGWYKMTDNEYMKLVIDIAKKGCGYVNPNPMVGAVIVKDDKIISTGYHERYGELHAVNNLYPNEPAVRWRESQCSGIN